MSIFIITTDLFPRCPILPVRRARGASLKVEGRTKVTCTISANAFSSFFITCGQKWWGYSTTGPSPLRALDYVIILVPTFAALAWVILSPYITIHSVTLFFHVRCKSHLGDATILVHSQVCLVEQSLFARDRS